MGTGSSLCYSEIRKGFSAGRGDSQEVGAGRTLQVHGQPRLSTEFQANSSNKVKPSLKRNQGLWMGIHRSRACLTLGSVARIALADVFVDIRDPCTQEVEEEKTKQTVKSSLATIGSLRPAWT